MDPVTFAVYVLLRPELPSPDHIKLLQEAHQRVERAQRRDIPSPVYKAPAYRPEDLQRMDAWLKKEGLIPNSHHFTSATQ